MKRLIRLTVNGIQHELLVSPHETLVEVLEKQLQLTGARECCGVGVCGACTVLLNGKPVSSCLTLAALTDGAEVVTIEGLRQGEKLHPLQEAFIEEGAFQCGYCTPGMILTGKALLDQNPRASEQEIVEYMSGNLCRCGSYPKIVKAIRAAQQKMSSCCDTSGSAASALD